MVKPLQNCRYHKGLTFRLWIILGVWIGFVEISSAQKLVLMDSFAGGVCADGFASSDHMGQQGKLELEVPPGATVRKALLLAGSHGDSTLLIKLNDVSIDITASSRFTGPFKSAYGTGYLHVMDITSIFDPTRKIHDLWVRAQPFPIARFNEFYVIVLYDEPAAADVKVSIYANTQHFASKMLYDIPQHEFEDPSPYALAIMGGYICNGQSDGERVKVNGTHIGILDTNDRNSGTCGGPVGSFHFGNGVLRGIGDDTPDDLMRRNDALANIARYLTKGAKSFPIEFDHMPNIESPNDNSIWAVVTVTGGSCALQTGRRDTTVCEGAPFRLTADKDVATHEYQWFSFPGRKRISGGSPIVNSSQSTQYLAQIRSADGCTTFDTLDVAVTYEGVSRTTELCLGGSFQLVPLRDTATNSIRWEEQATFVTLEGKTPWVTDAINGTYIGTTSGGDGCVFRDTVVVRTSSHGTLRDTNLCTGSTLQLRPRQDTNIVSYTWHDATSNSQLSGQSPIVTVGGSSLFIAKIRDAEGCTTFDSIAVDIRPLELIARFEEPEYVFDDEGGGVTILITSDPPLNVVTEQTLKLLIKANDELIRFDRVSIDDQRIGVRLQHLQDGYEIRVSIPDDYGLFSSARVALHGTSFLSVIESDSCAILSIEDSGSKACINPRVQEATITRRLPGCGDTPIRELLASDLSNVVVKREGAQLEISGAVLTSVEVLVSDVLGRTLASASLNTLPARIHIDQSRNPVFVMIRSAGYSFTRLLLP